MVRPARAGDDSRVLTLPNGVTSLRLALIPVFVWLLASYHRSGWLAAAFLLAALGATDWVDGFLARRLGQVSTVGKVLDPLADRLLLGVATISVVVVGAVPLWLALAVLAREGLVAAGFLYVAASGGRRMDVQWIGKAGTFATMCALPLFLAGHAPTGWHEVAEALAWLFAIPGLVLSWYAALSYLPMARAALSGERQETPA